MRLTPSELLRLVLALATKRPSSRCGKPPLVGSKKRPLSDEELKDQGWRQEERRYAWTHGGHGTRFQACIAKLAFPPADPAFIRHLVALAWTPDYAVILQRIVEEARRDPGAGSADRAIEAARQVWNDIMGKPRNVGGRPKSNDLKMCLAYSDALAAARRVDPKVKVGDVQAAFVQKYGLAKVRDLKEAIRRTRRRHGEWVVPKGQKTSL